MQRPVQETGGSSATATGATATATAAAPAVAAGSVLLRGATITVDGTSREVRDVHIRDGRIAAIVPTGTGGSAERTVDLDGYVLLPGLAEPHAHLDKALTADRVQSATGDLPGAIEAWLAFRPNLPAEDTAQRARAAALRYLAHGATVVQTHVDTGPDIGLRAFEALVAVRDDLRGLLDLRLVACGAMPFAGPDGIESRAILETAVGLGADAVGGAPALDEDPGAAIDLLLDLAVRHGKAVDLHVDETLDPSVLTLRLLAKRVRAGFPYRVTASHCVSLGAQSQAVQAEVAEALAEAGIGVVTLPITNLYLQGRHPSLPAPRGLTAIRALQAAGVTVAAGGDNLRDPFNPVGRADPLEAASLLVTAGHLSPAAALDAVSRAARAVAGAPPAGVRVGDIADLVAVRAESVGDAIGAAAPDRIVLRAGSVVSRTEVNVRFGDSAGAGL